MYKYLYPLNCLRNYNVEIIRCVGYLSNKKMFKYLKNV